MIRHVLVTGVVVVSLLGGVSACSGSDEKPETERTATKATTTAAPPPTPAPQPKGADGVTYEIQNWDEYADDPAVLAYKQVTEGISASSNERKVLPVMRKGLSKKLLKQYVPTLTTAWEKKWHVLKVNSARVRSASTTSTGTRLVMCEWNPSFSFYDKNGKVVGDVENLWDKVFVTMKSGADGWIVADVKVSGTCPGGAPS